MTRINPLHSIADLRAERHAVTFMRDQRPPRDPVVERLMAQGYLAQQIASILQKPLIDVRLAMAVVGKKERAR